MANPSFALVAALIWALSPIYYRTFLAKLEFLNLNLARTSAASLAMALPAFYFWSSGGIGFSILSGAITLALGDSLFLLSIKAMGASIAAPVVYTYVFLVQLSASLVGETVPLSNLVAALMVVAGVYVLSRSGGGRPRSRGIVMGISASLVWTVGQSLIQLATFNGGSIVTITFVRVLAAACALAAASVAMGKIKQWPRGLSRQDYFILILVAVSDLGLGSSLFVYSVSLIGIATTVILTSLSPLLTQVFSKLLGKESPSRNDFIGGVMIVAALIIAVAVPSAT